MVRPFCRGEAAGDGVQLPGFTIDTPPPALDRDLALTGYRQRMSIHGSAELRRFAPVVLALALAAPASGAAAASCAPAGAKVLETSGAARIYSAGTTLYGCLGAQRTRLGALSGKPGSPATRVQRYVLAGRFAGVDTVQMGVDTFSSTVSLRDLQTGATVATAPAATPLPGPESFVSVTQMALNRDGVLAWVGRSSGIGHPQAHYGLFLLDRHQLRSVAAGAVPLLSLRLTSTTVTWQSGHGGPRRSAPLAG